MIRTTLALFAFLALAPGACPGDLSAQTVTPRIGSGDSPRLSGCQTTRLPAQTPWHDGESVLCDLDGDGAQDHIRVTFNPDGWSFTVYVNQLKVSGSGASLDETFAIVDVDTLDGMREIAITENAGNPDHVTHFYACDGLRIFSMGSIPGSEDVVVDGSGTIRTKVPGRVLQEWSYTAPYQLGTDHKIERSPVDLYPMHTRVVVKKPLQLLRSRTVLVSAFRLAAGDTVEIVSSDDQEWVMVRNERGQNGWFALDSDGNLKGDGRAPQEVFQGLKSGE
jgi:hypothetical protein